MKKLLLTGGTGFLGKNIKPSLANSYEVTTLGLSPGEDIRVNIAAEQPALPLRYDIVLHAAAKAHTYPRTPGEAKAFFDVNYQGTVNLCQALEAVGVPGSFIFISSSAVYGTEKGENITEEFLLQGGTPYARSKILAENFLTEWAKANGVTLTILRAALLAGSGAPGSLGAMINGIRKGRYLSVNHGQAHKSMLMARDIANLIPLVLDKGGIYNVCDNDHPSFAQLESLISAQLHKRPPASIPLWLAMLLARIGDVIPGFPINSIRLSKMLTSNTMSSLKAQKQLGWTPLSTLENFRI